MVRLAVSEDGPNGGKGDGMVKALFAMLCWMLLWTLPSSAYAEEAKATPEVKKADVNKNEAKKTASKKSTNKKKDPKAKQRHAATTKSNKKNTDPDYCPAPSPIPQDASCYALRDGRGRCEPQSVPYARCRSGIMSCRNNCDFGPVALFRCEQSMGNTQTTPKAGSIFILGDNSKHKMPTGHAYYVDEVEELGGGKWMLTLSHTNHDRRCSLEVQSKAVYDEPALRLDVKSGAWAAWGRNLKAEGFIIR